MSQNRCNLSLPINPTAGIILSFLFKQKRSLHADAVRIIRSQGIKIQFIGEPPPPPPFMIVTNHFSQTGFSILWTVMAIQSRLNLPTRWLMSNRWTFPDRKLGFIYEGFMARVFKRIAYSYNLVSTPALPSHPGNTISAAIAIRSLVNLYKSDPMMTLGVSPEGRDFLGGRLGKPSRGTGLMINELLKIHSQVLPVGFYYKKNQYYVNFGKMYALEYQSGKERDQIDRDISEVIMRSIAILLPDEMHGKYS